MSRKADAQRQSKSLGTRPRQQPIRDRELADDWIQPGSIKRREQSAIAICPRPQPSRRIIRDRVIISGKKRPRTGVSHVSNLCSFSPEVPAQARRRTGHFHKPAIAFACPSRRRLNSPSPSTLLSRMTSFDPATVRQAVAEFTPRRPEKFQDLIPAKDVIAELRQKRASYRAISELLTQHCLPTSKTAVAAFCHEVLGEIIRPRRRPGRRRPVVPSLSPPEVTQQQPAETLPVAESSANGKGDDSQPPRSRGPRIAQVRMLKPQTA